MEREILLHLDYDCFIPAEQYVPLPSSFPSHRPSLRPRETRTDPFGFSPCRIVHRAQYFWLSRELATCSSQSSKSTNTKVVVLEADEDSLSSLEVDSFDLSSPTPAVQIQQGNLFRNVAYSSAYAL